MTDQTPPYRRFDLPDPKGTTPGPWHAHYTVHGDPYVVSDPTRPAFTNIAIVSTAEKDYGKANALLIASAPSMLAALRAVLGWVEEQGCSCDEVDLSPEQHHDECAGRVEYLIRHWSPTANAPSEGSAPAVSES